MDNRPARAIVSGGKLMAFILRQPPTMRGENSHQGRPSSWSPPVFVRSHIPHLEGSKCETAFRVVDPSGEQGHADNVMLTELLVSYINAVN